MPAGSCGPVGQSIAITARWSSTADVFVGDVGLSQASVAEHGCRRVDTTEGHGGSVTTSPQEAGVMVIDIHRLDVTTGERVPIISGWDQAVSNHPVVGMSGDGRRAIVLGRPTVVFDIDTGDVVQSIEIDDAVELVADQHDAAVALDSDGSMALIVGGEGSMLANIHDVATGSSILEGVPVSPSDERMFGAWFTDDGSAFYVASSEGLRLYDARTGVRLPVEILDRGVTLARVTPDGRRLAVFGGLRESVVPLEVGASSDAGWFGSCPPTASSEPAYLDRGLAVHEDLLSVHAYCEDRKESSVYTYDRTTGALVTTSPAFGRTFAVADNSVAAIQNWTRLDDGSIRAGEVSLVDLRTGQRVETLPGVCSIDARRYLAGSVSCEEGEEIAVSNSDVAISPDGAIVAIGSSVEPRVGVAWEPRRAGGARTHRRDGRDLTGREPARGRGALRPERGGDRRHAPLLHR